MPIKVVVSVNDDTVTTVQIARTHSLSRDPDKVNEYAAVITDEPTWMIDWDAAETKIYHRYGDGVNVLVAKTLDALFNPPGVNC